MNISEIVKKTYKAGTGEELLHPPQEARQIRAAYTSRQSASLIALISVMAGIIVAWWASQPSDVHAVPPPTPVSSPVSDQNLVDSQDEPGGTVIVYVSGHVAQPGVIELAEGMRMADALDAAGGFTEEADPHAVNLARVVTDGEHIHFPAPGEIPVQTSGSEDSGDLININTATSDRLQELPGIGPATAEKILDHRESIGAFTAIDELLEISGIGPATLDKLRDHVTL